MSYFVKLPPGMPGLLPALAGMKLLWVFIKVRWSCCSADTIAMNLSCALKKKKGGWEITKSWCGVSYLIALVPLWVDSQAEECDVLLAHAVWICPSVLWELSCEILVWWVAPKSDFFFLFCSRACRSIDVRWRASQHRYPLPCLLLKEAYWRR